MTTLAGWQRAHGDLPRLELELLLGEHLALGRAQVIAHPEQALPADTRSRLDADADRLRQGEPLAYVLGRREFWGLDLRVTPDVLIPRPETELLVESALTLLAGTPGARPWRLLDLGTGSGAIALALAQELGSRAELSAVDSSAAALAVAADNGRRHGLRVQWLQGDWFDPVDGPFDLVLGNPPYVACGDPHLPALKHEPHAALVAGPHGLDALTRIIREAPEHLHRDGWLALEHGWDQGAAVRRLFEEHGFTAVDTRRDLGGRERVTLGRFPGPEADPEP